MKDLIIIGIIIALIFGGSYLTKRFFKTSGDEILKELSKLKSDIDNNSNEEEKNKKVEEIKKMWDEKQNVWIILQYHQVINDMEDLLIECCNYYLDGDKVEFTINFEKFERAVKDLEKREKISFVNVM